MIERQTWYCVVAIGGSLLAACGGDDDAASTSGSGGRGGSGRAGQGGAPETAGITGAAAGAPSLTDLVNMINMALTPMCDSSAVSETKCGSTDCPALPDNASASCTINCCSPEQKCGTRIADTRIQQFLGTQCVATAEPDMRCPTTTVVGQSLVGCCDPQGNCGQILFGTCLPSATAAMRCDGSSTTSDAGTGM